MDSTQAVVAETTTHRAWVGAAILVISLSESVLAAGSSVFSPVSPPAQSIRDVFILVLIITGVIFLLVEGLLIYNLICFRAKVNDRQGDPPQIYGVAPLELAWTVAPLLIVFVLFLVVVRTVVAVNRPRLPANAINVQVIGHRWWWEFRYPDLEVRAANELHIPVSDSEHPRPVELDLFSADVIHSLWVPELAGKTDLVPGRTNHMWFQTDAPGVYPGQCAEYCGTQHANMRLLVIAEPPEQFAAWAKHQAEPAVNDPTLVVDRQRFLSLACINCHRVAGTLAQGTFGPDLTHLMSRRTLGAVTLTNDRQGLKDWIDNPQLHKPGCLMPNMQLTDEDVRQVVKYLSSLQ